MVKIKSPLRSKGLDVAGNVKGLFGVYGKGIQVFDNDRMVILNLKD